MWRRRLHVWEVKHAGNGKTRCAHYLGGDHSCTQLLGFWWKSGICPCTTVWLSPLLSHPRVTESSLPLQATKTHFNCYVPCSRATCCRHLLILFTPEVKKKHPTWTSPPAYRGTEHAHCKLLSNIHHTIQCTVTSANSSVPETTIPYNILSSTSVFLPGTSNYLLLTKILKYSSHKTQGPYDSPDTLVCTVYSVLYSEIPPSQKPFGIRYRYTYTFLLKWPILWLPRILAFPPGKGEEMKRN
jgi:hypothetical protein